MSEFYGLALRRASAAMKAEAAEIEANLQPTPYDEELPIHDEWWLAGSELLPSYIDQADENAEPIDFNALGRYVLDRRTLAMKKRGVIYGTEDDWFAIPQYRALVGFMRPDQVERHMDGLLAAGLDITDIWHRMPRAYIEQNRAHLLELGVKRKTIRKVLGETILKNLFKKN